MKLIFVAVLVAMLATSTVTKVTNITDEIAQIQKAIVEEKLVDISNECVKCVKDNCAQCIDPCTQLVGYDKCAKCLAFECLTCVGVCTLPSKPDTL